MSFTYKIPNQKEDCEGFGCGGGVGLFLFVCLFPYAFYSSNNIDVEGF